MASETYFMAIRGSPRISPAQEIVLRGCAKLGGEVEVLCKSFEAGRDRVSLGRIELGTLEARVELQDIQD
jgi:hypothetical protein